MSITTSGGLTPNPLVPGAYLLVGNATMSGTGSTSVTVTAAGTLTVTGAGTSIDFTNVTGTSVATTIDVTGGASATIDALAGISALSTFEIGNSSTLTLGAGINAAVLPTIDFGNSSGTLQLANGAASLNVGEQITNFGPTSSIVFGNATYTGGSYANGALTLTGPNGATTTVPLTADAAFSGEYFHLSTTNGNTTLVLNNVAAGGIPACYCRGTLILTDRGEVPVEALAIGDTVVTASGEHRPIKWIGHNTVDCRHHADLAAILPIRVQAEAFGPGLPASDLWLSPGHAICVDLIGEGLVRIGDLVNGATISQEQVDRVEYWHVELDSHDLLMAQGMPAESYIDVGNKTFFEAGSGVLDVPGLTLDGYCYPLILDEPTLAVLRARLLARATKLGWSVEQAPTTMHLVADGMIIEPEVEAGLARFIVPAGTTEIWLHSATFVPKLVGMNADTRRLGACITGIRLDNGLSVHRVVRPDDPSLCVGFHVPVPDGSHIWTAGAALLSSDLWADCRGAFFLTVAFDHCIGCHTWRQTSSEPARTATLPQLRLVHAA